VKITQTHSGTTKEKQTIRKAALFACIWPKSTFYVCLNKKMQMPTILFGFILNWFATVKPLDYNKTALFFTLKNAHKLMSLHNFQKTKPMPKMCFLHTIPT